MSSPLFLRALGGTVSHQLRHNLTGYHKTKEFLNSITALDQTNS